jgi:hypothetical protein
MGPTNFDDKRINELKTPLELGKKLIQQLQQIFVIEDKRLLTFSSKQTSLLFTKQYNNKTEHPISRKFFNDNNLLIMYIVALLLEMRSSDTYKKLSINATTFEDMMVKSKFSEFFKIKEIAWVNMQFEQHEDRSFCKDLVQYLTFDHCHGIHVMDSGIFGAKTRTDEKCSSHYELMINIDVQTDENNFEKHELYCRLLISDEPYSKQIVSPVGIPNINLSETHVFQPIGNTAKSQKEAITTPEIKKDIDKEKIERNKTTLDIISKRLADKAILADGQDKERIEKNKARIKADEDATKSSLKAKEEEERKRLTAFTAAKMLDAEAKRNASIQRTAEMKAKREADDILAKTLAAQRTANHNAKMLASKARTDALKAETAAINAKQSA